MDSPSETNLHSSVSRNATDVLQSYAQATSTHHIYFSDPGLKSEEYFIVDNNIYTLVDRKSHMVALPSFCLIKVKSATPKIRIVAKVFRQVHRVDYHETRAQS